MDAYLEEDLIVLFIYCTQNSVASDLKIKKQRIEEIGKDVKSYRVLRNGITDDWKY